MLWKRALWSLSKRPGNTVLLFLTCFVISTLVLSSLLIQSGVQQSNKSAREQLGAVVILKYDFIKELLSDDQGIVEASNFQLVPASIADQFTTLPHVVGHNYFNISFMKASNFEPYPADMDMLTIDSTNVSVHEILDSASYTRFTDGTDKLIAGRHITYEDRGKLKVLIERHLAELNELNINDTITISNDNGDEYEFEIAGIYESSLYGQIGTVSNALQAVPNKVYVSFGGMTEQLSPGAEQYMSRGYYYLDDPEYINTFIKEAEQSGIVNLDVFHFSANEKSYSEMTGAITQVASISLIIQLLVMGAGTTILALILILSVRGRMREIGILMSLGEKRARVISQLLIEMFSILFIAFFLSLFAGNLIAQQLGNEFIQQQAITLEEQRALFSEDGLMTEDYVSDLNDPVTNKQFETIKEIEIGLTLNQLLLLAVIGFGIGFIAIFIPVLLIVRLKPREILIKSN